jgi:hypothetical protein
MKQIQNNQKILENPYQPTGFKNFEKKSKCLYFQKQPYGTLGYGIKNLLKILAYGFLFFVISISGHSSVLLSKTDTFF